MHDSIVWEGEPLLAIDRRPWSTFGMRLEQTDNGALLLGTDAAGEGKTQSWIYRSDDGGITWRFLAIASFAEGDAGNTQLIRLPGGVLLNAYRDVRWVADNLLRVALRVARSQDRGITWTHWSDIVETEMAGFRGVWEPFLGLLPDGTLGVMYASEAYQPQWPQVIAMKYSRDGGRTWSEETRVSEYPSSRDGMPVFARAADGRVVVVMESTDCAPQEFAIRAKWSPDGYDWQGPRLMVYRPAPGGKKAGAPFVAAHPDGRLFVSFQTDEDNAGFSEPACDFKMIVSRDQGRTWGEPQTIIKGPYANWGGLYLDGVRRLLAGASACGADGVHRIWLNRGYI